MAISISRYISINSAVLGQTIVGVRQLILNLFTTNPLLPSQSYATFTSAAEVGQYFGTTSEEYYRAANNYFGWTSKNNYSPPLIQFSRWVPVDIAGTVVGYGADLNVSDWTAITDGSIGLTIGNYTSQVSSLDFSGASTLADVATTLTNAIQAITAGMTDWTSAVVTYASNVFTLTGGVVGVEAIAVQKGTTGHDISGAVTSNAQLGWYNQASTSGGVYTPGAIWSNGSAAESITTTLTNAYNANNNWGTFAFLYTQIPATVVLSSVTADTSATVTGIPTTEGLAVGMAVSGTHIASNTTIASIVSTTSITLSLAATGSGTVSLTYTTNNSGLTLPQYVEAATWNNSLTPNNQFKLLVPVTSGNASSWSTALAGYAGTCLTLTNYVAPVTSTTPFYEQCDAVIEAATNYNPGAINSVQNYMFQLFPTLPALVNSDSAATTYDNETVNYIGVTQNAGQQISFYQRGFLLGGPTAALDSGVYANEQWLKSAITTAIMNLLLSQSYVPANNQGQAQITATLQNVIQQALLNGTISVGKTLTTSQIQSITTVTGNPLAWQQVQNSGFYLLVVIQPRPGHPGEYQAVYTLVYSKNDVIRFVQGFDDLI